jgi:hypothetical protein
MLTYVAGGGVAIARGISGADDVCSESDVSARGPKVGAPYTDIAYTDVC